MKKNLKSVISIVLILAMTLSMVFTFAGCSAGTDGKDGVTPKLRINADTNYWEVSYDEGDTWESMGVKATGEDGKDGQDGINGTNGQDGKDGVDGTDGEDGKDGVDGTDGEDGKDGVNGTDGKDGVDGKDGEDVSLEDILKIIEEYETFKTVAALIDDVNFGSANCAGTNACFASVYYRVLTDDHGYYNGASRIENYLKNVFVENDGVVEVNSSSGLRRISYSNSLTLINFASAFSSYNEYIVRNNLTMPEDIAAQKELAIKFFNQVDYTAEGYNTPIRGDWNMSTPSMAHGVIALGSLMEQKGTDRFDTLIKNAYDNYVSSFWDQSGYNNAFYQLCADYEWFDETKIPTVTTLTDANILNYYGYGIDVAKDYPELWDAWESEALSDNALDAGEAKAFAYHYAYQISNGDVDLGVYGSSRAIVDFSKFQ